VAVAAPRRATTNPRPASMVNALRCGGEVVAPDGRSARAAVSALSTTGAVGSDPPVSGVDDVLSESRLRSREPSARAAGPGDVRQSTRREPLWDGDGAQLRPSVQRGRAVLSCAARCRATHLREPARSRACEGQGGRPARSSSWRRCITSTILPSEGSSSLESRVPWKYLFTFSRAEGE
jgi:hypothetical protein